MKYVVFSLHYRERCMARNSYILTMLQRKINDYDRLYKEKELLLTTITEKNVRLITLNEENKLLKEQLQHESKTRFISKETSATSVQMNMTNNSTNITNYKMMNSNSKRNSRYSPMKQKSYNACTAFNAPNYSEMTTPSSYAMRYRSAVMKDGYRRKKQSSAVRISLKSEKTARNVSVVDETLFIKNDLELCTNLSQELSLRNENNNSNSNNNSIYIQTLQINNEVKPIKHKVKQRSCKDIMKFINGKNSKDSKPELNENEIAVCLNEYDNVLKEEISLLNDEEYLITKLLSEHDNNNDNTNLKL